ncbi:MAG: hypothetical protein Q4F84_03220 [Fibrobacter sp.]|nr:hypothetical protein [Fibrobacter sp.]
MTDLAMHTIEIIFISGYVAFGCILNLIALLISAFNQKKFNQSSPVIGFVVAIILALVFILILFSNIRGPIPMPIQFVLLFSLLGSCIASALSTVTLFFAMRKVNNR